MYNMFLTESPEGYVLHTSNLMHNYQTRTVFRGSSTAKEVADSLIELGKQILQDIKELENE